MVRRANRQRNQMNKVTIDSKTLLSALKRLSPAINANTVLPVLESVKMEVGKDTARMIASNLSLTLITSVPVASDAAFEVLLPFAELQRIAQVTVTPLVITLKDNSIVIESGLSDLFQLGKAEDAKSFPKVPELTGGTSLELTAEMIDAMVQAEKCIDGIKMQGFYLDFRDGKLFVVGTDGFVIYQKTFPFALDKPVAIVVPQGFTRTISELKEAKATFTDRLLGVESDNLHAITVLSEQRVADYRRVMDYYDKGASGKVDVQSLNKALDKMTVYKSPVVFHKLLFLTDGGVEMLFSEAAMNREIKTSITADIRTDADHICFKTSLLKSLLSTVPEGTGEVDVYVCDRAKPMVITVPEKDTKLLAMPFVSDN